MSVDDKIKLAQSEHKIQEESMENSWKDEFIVGVFSLPIIVNFLYPLFDSTYTLTMAWENLSKAPEWFQSIISILVLVIFGLRAIVYRVADKLFDTSNSGGCKCKK